MSDELLKSFTVEEDALKDALNYARGHLVNNDVDAAMNSMGDAQNALGRIEELLEDANEGA